MPGAVRRPGGVPPCGGGGMNCVGLLATATYAARIAPYRLREDAVQEAWLGIVQADSHFDGRCELRTFASQRARGQVLDYLRRNDPLSRSHRRAVKAGKAEPIRYEPVLEHHKFTAATQEQDAIHAEVRLWLRFLSDRERRIVIRLLDGIPESELACEIGLSRGRVHQIKRRAIARIREGLKLA